MPYIVTVKIRGQKVYGEEELHLGSIPCVLCRMKARPNEDIRGRYAFTLGNVMDCADCSICKQGIEPRFPNHCWWHRDCMTELIMSGVYPESDLVEIVWKSTIAITSKYNHLESNEQQALIASEGIRAMPTVITSRPRMERPLPLACLPFEILNMITVHAGLHPQLTVIGETNRLFKHAIVQKNSVVKGQSSEILLDKPIHVCCTLFRGVSYIAAVSNAPFNNTSAFTEPPVHIQLPEKPRWILVAFDHVGVRTFQVLEAKNSRPVVSGHPWYRLIKLQANNSITLSFNGLFLRSIGPANPAESNWNIPFPLSTRNWNTCGKSADWNSMVDLTVPGLKGLLVAFQSREVLLGIHAFTGTDAHYDRFSLQMRSMESPKERLRWSYFALQQGESLVKAWVCGRRSLFPDSKLGGLVVRKNPFENSIQALTPLRYWQVKSSLGRFHAFGGYKSSRPLIRPLTADGDGAITTLLYSMQNPHEGGICQIGAICESWASPKRTLIQQMDGTYNRENIPGIVPSLRDSIRRDFNWAPLENLKHIQLTKLHPLHRYNGAVGAILRYNDGKTEALGEIDWDLGFCEPISTPIEGLRQYYGLGKYCDLRTAQPGIESPEWVPWPTQGIVVWAACDFGEPRLFFR